MAAALGTTSLSTVQSGAREAMGPPQGRAFLRMCRRRLRHEPVQYIVGDWDFHCLQGILVRAPVLIPRPETEELVELVVDHCRRSFESSQALKVLEVGCGSGAVSIALLRSLDRATATCIDVDPAAVALTQENALRFKVQDRLRVVQCPAAHFRDPTTFDIVVSNPPYIPTARVPTLDPTVREYESWTALDGGEDGLAVIEDVVRGCGRWLSAKPTSRLFLEMDATHAISIVSLVRTRGQGHLCAPLVRKDHTGTPRFAEAGWRDHTLPQ